MLWGISKIESKQDFSSFFFPPCFFFLFRCAINLHVKFIMLYSYSLVFFIILFVVYCCPPVLTGELHNGVLLLLLKERFPMFNSVVHF